MWKEHRCSPFFTHITDRSVFVAIRLNRVWMEQWIRSSFGMEITVTGWTHWWTMCSTMWVTLLVEGCWFNSQCSVPHQNKHLDDWLTCWLICCRGRAVAWQALLIGWRTLISKVWTWPIPTYFPVPVSHQVAPASTRPGAPSCWTSPSRCLDKETTCLIRYCSTYTILEYTSILSYYVT